MNALDGALLSLVTFVPLVGAFVVLFAPQALARGLALATSLVAAALAARVHAVFDPADGRLQLVEKHAWIPTLNADYFVGVDGIGALLVGLCAILVPIAILASWRQDKNPRAYFFFVLAVQAGTFGVFTAQSFLHWFLFWELVLVPAFFLVKMWGAGDASRAALKFFLYTLVGSVFMLLAFQAIYLATGTQDFAELARMGASGELDRALAALAAKAGLGWSAQACGAIAFLAIVFAAAVKTPMWPFHTWLPDGYAAAPTPVTMLLTGMLSKMGVYALLRLALPLFPAHAADWSTPLLVLAVVTVVAGALSALAQTDLKRMMAYSSINHVGYCLLGAFAAATGGAALVDDRAAALDGVVVQMFNHGVTAACLFLLIGAMEERTGKRGIDDFGGLRATMPRFCLLFGVALFSSLGLPALNGFVGELLILKGTVALAPWAAVLATIGVVVTAVFLLKIMQRVWSGPTSATATGLQDVTAREKLAAGVLVAFMLAGGLAPGPFVRTVDAASEALVAGFAAGRAAASATTMSGAQGVTP